MSSENITRINGEPVERVTSFESLRAGQTVWYLPCSFCGGKHRHLIMNGRTRMWQKADRTVGESFVYDALPTSSCDHDELGTCIGPETVRNGKVYRVVLDLGITETVTTRKAEPVGEDLVRRSARGLHPLGAWRR